MKKIVFIVAFFILCKPVIPLLDYIFNYEYIVTVLCENKAKPNLSCNGKCHLMKSLAKESESEKPLSSDKKSTVFEKEEWCIFTNEIKSQLYIRILVKPTLSVYHSISYKWLFDHFIFHPPLS